jgi:hypothetical protein
MIFICVSIVVQANNQPFDQLLQTQHQGQLATITSLTILSLLLFRVNNVSTSQFDSKIAGK